MMMSEEQEIIPALVVECAGKDFTIRSADGSHDLGINAWDTWNDSEELSIENNTFQHEEAPWGLGNRLLSLQTAPANLNSKLKKDSDSEKELEDDTPESIPYEKNGEMALVTPLPKKRSDNNYDLPVFDHDTLLHNTNRYLGICFCHKGGFYHTLPNGTDLWVHFPECTWGRSCPYKSECYTLEEDVPREYKEALHEEQTWMAARAVAIENYFTLCSEIADRRFLRQQQKQHNARMKEIQILQEKRDQERRQLLLQKDIMKEKKKRTRSREVLENQKKQKTLMKEEAKRQKVLAKAEKANAKRQGRLAEASKKKLGL
jgi:hypothetical protein